MLGETRNKRRFDFRRFVTVWFGPVLAIGPWFTAAPVWFAVFCSVFFGLGWFLALCDGGLPGYRRTPAADYWMATPWRWRVDGVDHAGVRVPLRYNPGFTGVAVLLLVGIAMLAPAVIRISTENGVFGHPTAGARTAKESAMFFFTFYGSLLSGALALARAVWDLVGVPVRSRSLLLSSESLWMPGREKGLSWLEMGGVRDGGPDWGRRTFKVLSSEGDTLASVTTQIGSLPLDVIVEGVRNDPALRGRLGEQGADKDVNGLVPGRTP
ncbi:hypothetical protein [Mycobacteroides salmoniphilum]|uniref:hypothetical protein n=1 Tax=Mycobacteroides salmoniphilum TaxID=404941 RepID=UPI001064C297|nr:hypothetical protein [Mycobacteroides salmoniphilum]TDZ75769.1 hypothetical protein DE4586_03662 [Mycobacteroides salmoniphilum]TDZ84288.1 hypothetical protein DE4587_03204 [Mycobacteroides salmoniphilum]